MGLVLGILLALWLEPLANIAGPVPEYNANTIGPVSSWGPYVPGWGGAPEHHITAQPLTLVLCWLAGTIVGIGLGELLIRFRRRHPGMSTRRFVLIFIVACTLTTNLQAPLFFALGFVRWSRGIDGLTLWPGTWHQFPLYETVGFTVLMLGLVGFYYWSRTRGPHFLQPAAPPCPRRLGEAVPILAVIGVVNTVMLSYVAFMALAGQLATITVTELPAFWSTP
ncbi:spirocyclase AveC family protein [Streptomyces sp. KLMMK]|uniref:spirocyclase AveC family protein n=1 Tax=Streptomyces sp. KLMMK TaxID=3109353 RepID=UPI0030084301